MRAKTLAAAEGEVERPYLRAALLCGLVLFLEGYDIAAVGYAIPSLVDVWRVDPSAFTGALVAGNIGLVFGSTGAGLLGDRAGRRPVLICCVTVFGVFSLLSAFVDSPMQLASLRLLTGLGLGGGIPLAIALVSDLAPPTVQGRVVILTAAGVPIGFTLGGLLASQLVPLFGWPAIFVLGGVLPLAMVPLLALSLPESIAPGRAARPRNLVAALFRDRYAPYTALLWAMNFLNLLSNFLVLLWAPAILHSSGAGPSQAIFATSMLGLGIILGALLTAAVADRLGVERVLTYAVAFGALCVLSVGLLELDISALSVIICGAGVGIGGCQAGLFALFGRIYPPHIRSTGAGWALGLGRVGAIVGPLLGGVLLGLGFQAKELFNTAAVPLFAVTALMAILGRLRRSGEAGRSANGLKRWSARPTIVPEK
jgi:AAHS family 4-hydroxybenzoate transporter-like MFS transporter